MAARRDGHQHPPTRRASRDHHAAADTRPPIAAPAASASHRAHHDDRAAPTHGLRLPGTYGAHLAALIASAPAPSARTGALLRGYLPSPPGHDHASPVTGPEPRRTHRPRLRATRGKSRPESTRDDPPGSTSRAL